MQDEHENDFIEKVGGEAAATTDTIKRPVFTKQAEWHQQQYQQHREKASQEFKEERKRRYEDNVRGLKHINKRLCAKRARPLLAVVRDRTGPAGEPTGSVTTDPGEIDEVAIRAWSSIYAGASGDRAERAEKFLEQYNEHIYARHGEF